MVDDGKPPERIPRGGPSAWVVFVVGPLLGAIIIGGGLLVTIARMPDGSQFREIVNAMAAIKQDVAVSRARQDAADQLANERNEYLKAQLSQLIGQRRK